MQSWGRPPHLYIRCSCNSIAQSFNRGREETFPDQLSLPAFFAQKPKTWSARLGAKGNVKKPFSWERPLPIPHNEEVSENADDKGRD